MAFTCTISKQMTASVEQYPTGATRIAVSITAVTDFTDKGLFLAQEIAGVTTFISVCNAISLASYQLDKADPASGFKRVTSLDVIVKDSDSAQLSLDGIVAQLSKLCIEKTRLAALSSPVTQVIGA
jgi:hypothetical protein